MMDTRPLGFQCFVEELYAVMPGVGRNFQVTTMSIVSARIVVARFTMKAIDQMSGSLTFYESYPRTASPRLVIVPWSIQ